MTLNEVVIFSYYLLVLVSLVSTISFIIVKKKYFVYSILTFLISLSYPTLFFFYSIHREFGTTELSFLIQGLGDFHPLAYLIVFKTIYLLVWLHFAFVKEKLITFKRINKKEKTQEN